MNPRTSFDDLVELGEPTYRASAELLEETVLEAGFRLPLSYKDFAQRFGHGLLMGLFIVYIPGAGYSDLQTNSAEKKAFILYTLGVDFLLEFEPDGSDEIVRQLIPFGISENGETLLWHPNEQTGADECAIYVIASKGLGVTRAAENLYEFVAKCADERVKTMLGIGQTPLQRVFKPSPPPR